jgi:hypothetical protein
MSQRQSLSSIAPTLFVCALTFFAAGCGRVGGGKLSGAPEFDTPYQAVLLDTGLVYYGKVTGLDTDYPVLHDVYYVQQATDEKTRQVSTVLVRRGNEWHSPSMTVLNARHIVLVEPVGANSKVAQLIAEDQQRNPK